MGHRSSALRKWEKRTGFPGATHGEFTTDQHLFVDNKSLNSLTFVYLFFILINTYCAVVVGS